MLKSASVYRIYDEDGGLLYVGHSNNVRLRVRSHLDSSEWCRGPITTRVNVYPSRKRARAVEKRAIKMLRPRHNKQDNPDWVNPRHALAACHARDNMQKNDDETYADLVARARIEIDGMEVT